jgi:hypothetical protein
LDNLSKNNEFRTEANHQMAEQTLKLEFFLALDHVGHEGKNKFPWELS